MSDAPALSDLLFSAEHTWAARDGEEFLVGVSDFAQAALGPLVYVDLPAIGSLIEYDTSCGMLESAKTASDVIAPLTGRVTAVNEAAVDDPELVNRAPLHAGWLLRIAPEAPLDAGLMDAAAYAAFLDGMGSR